jgi:hypothetical protein
MARRSEGVNYAEEDQAKQGNPHSSLKPMHKTKSINELLNSGGPRLGALVSLTRQRQAALEQVRAALPPELAAVVVSAGIDRGVLTVGVAGGPWAARLRYSTDLLRERMGGATGIDIQGVRIKVVPPR